MDQPLRLYECSGLRVLSELSLPARLADEASVPDIYLRMAEPIARPTAPSSDIVAMLEIDGQPRYTIYRVADGYVCRFETVADIHISQDLKVVRCYPHVDGPTDFIPIIIVGTVVAFVLAVSGHCVLHASAVEVRGGALAFVGASGQGKSTMAALFASAGAPLVADDVLSLDIDATRDPSVVRCTRSGTEIRLREKVASLIERFDGEVAVRTTIDDRRAVAARTVSREHVPLVGIVLPRPDRQQRSVTARHLGAAEASLWLTGCQRIEGWKSRDHLRQQFENISAVVDAVPVIEVHVPWGPPFNTNLPDEILEACGL